VIDQSLAFNRGPFANGPTIIRKVVFEYDESYLSNGMIAQ